MNLIVLVMAMFSSISVFAADDGSPSQFNGKWTGTGVYRRAGEQTFCRGFSMEFDGTDVSMSFLGGARVCDTHTEAFAAVTMAYKAGQLFYDKDVVGSIEGNVLRVQFSAPEDDGRIRNYRMGMRKEGDNIVYEESRTMDSESTPLISFAGILHR